MQTLSRLCQLYSPQGYGERGGGGLVLVSRLSGDAPSCSRLQLPAVPQALQTPHTSPGLGNALMGKQELAASCRASGANVQLCLWGGRGRAGRSPFS